MPSPQFPSDPEPNTCAANPGRGVEFRKDLGDRIESTNVVDCLVNVVAEAGHRFTRGKGWIELAAGLVLQPRIAEIHSAERNGVRTVTTIEVSHAKKIPPGVFEFQHATGNDLRSSFVQGFENWERLDLPVFLDLLSPKPEFCMSMVIEAPELPGRKRQIILGPVWRYGQQPAADEAEEHPFCPCCMFRSAAETFMEMVKLDELFAIRMFAMRDERGQAAADCRVNGLGWDAGMEALKKYVEGWRARGVEMRKQFILIATAGDAR